MAPEQVTGEEEVDFSVKVDTWGLGVVAYELMHGRTPFRWGTVKNLMYVSPKQKWQSRWES